jgi:very-short-patch-repair endonuclease
MSYGFKKTCGKSECKTAALAKASKIGNDTQINKWRRVKAAAETGIKSKLIETYCGTEKTIKELAIEFKLSHASCRRMLHESGVTTTHSKAKARQQLRLNRLLAEANVKLLCPDFRKTCIDLKRSSKDIAADLGCSADYVCKIFRKAGTPLPRIPDSKIQIRLHEFFKSNIDANCKSNDRSIITPLELDITSEKFKVAIEVNGVYFHNVKFKDKHYHHDKTMKCKASGYDLLHFTDIELEEKFSIAANIIKAKCNLLTNRIMARETSVQELDANQYREFCRENHIQGSCPAKIKIGLFCKDELVSIMSFAKPRFDKKHQYEMIRYCNKLDTYVIGGASKLFSYFTKAYDVDSCISYCSRSYFNGSFHSHLGFCLVRASPPSYYWIKSDGTKISRYQSQRHRLNTDLTEDAFMQSQNYMKIYDCGQNVYSFRRNQTQAKSEI